MAEQGGEVTFDEKDVLKEQVGAKSAAALEQADHIAREIATEAIMMTMNATMVAFDRFRSYAKTKVEKEGGLYEKFDHASELVADLVEVAAEEMIEDVPVIGVLFKHGALLGLHAANEHESVEAAAAEMIAEMSQQRGDAASAVPGLLEEHKYDIRNAYSKAKDPSEKESAIKATLAGLGIAVPKPDAGAHIFQRLVEKLNLDAWIAACRSGKSGKTAECATDGAVPDIKKGAEQDTKEAFHEDDGKKQEKGKAVPIG